MRMLIVQPHRDDAIFSIAEHMITWLEDGHQLSIQTVFGGIPFDGHDDAQIRKHITLEMEHREAMKRLGEVDMIDTMFLDHGCGLGRTDTEAIIESIWTTGHDVVVAPQGIHHDDHIQVTHACFSATQRKNMPMWIYDELPYFALYPELSFARYTLDGYEREGCRDHYEAKLRLTKCYPSQIGRTEVRTLMCPERVWRPKT